MTVFSTLRKHGPTTYYTKGREDAQPLIFLHGVGLNATMWESQVVAFAKDYRVVCPNFLGHGGSHNPEGERSIDDLVNQVVQLIDHLGYTKINLAGFSLGGIVAQRFGCDHPQRLHTLIILNAIYQRTQEEAAATKTRYAQTKNLGPMVNVEAALERWFTPAFRANHPDRLEAVRDMFKAHKDDGYRKAYRIFASDQRYVTASELKNINCPTLVVTGENDVGSNPRMSYALARDIKQAECHIVAGARHMAPVEHADIYNQLIGTFLKLNSASHNEHNIR